MRISHFFNGEGIEILHRPAAHTDGDSIVRFRGSDVIATGDLFVTETYPVIDIERGGNIQGVVESLNRILDLAFPEFRTEGGTMIVPGHGRIADSADVAYYRDMVTIIRDRVQGMIKKGMTLEQVKSAKPTADYDPRYGATTGPLDNRHVRGGRIPQPCSWCAIDRSAVTDPGWRGSVSRCGVADYAPVPVW